MDIALYHPDGGYYTDDSHFGAEGDYYTGPAVHPAFGALLAVQFEQMWRLLGRPSPFWVIELGTGTGHLARAVVSTAADLSDGFHSS
ncbi:MAG: SAM-dependent methyltransferase, partial [Bacteroidetes bacterium]|nr:SAM-dependent methyltransferase [Bacteroidota bacterium]